MCYKVSSPVGLIISLVLAHITVNVVCEHFQTARCRVRCLDQLHDPGGFNIPVSVAPNLMALCIQDNNCTTCMKPCSAPFVDMDTCTKVCQEKEDACKGSCQFLKHMSNINPGTCPPINFDNNPRSICVAACSGDKDCGATAKCCDIGCGHACRVPYDVPDIFPSTPSSVTVRERTKGNAVELSWTMDREDGPILYMVQWRWNVGHHHSEEHSTPWTAVTVTVQTTAVVRDIDAGKWYQFRVVAVNINGSRGYSLPSHPFKSDREPRAPNPPGNISEGSVKVVADRVFVTIHWQPPRKTDLPVTRYKVYWSKRLKQQNPLAQHEHRKVLKGDELEFEIPDLDPDTTYSVQVQAISQYGDEDRLKSEKTSTNITTIALFPQALQQDFPPSSTESVPLTTPKPITDLTLLRQPYFNNGLIKANVTWRLPPGGHVTKTVLQWRPAVCLGDAQIGDSFGTITIATNGSVFTIYDLRFGCRYTLTAQPVSAENIPGPDTRITFSVPECSDIRVIGSLVPDCPTTVPQIPQMPVNLQYRVTISMDNNITAQLEWDDPHHPVLGYKVVWRQIDEESGQHLSDEFSKLVPKDSTVFNINDLLEHTTYRVQVLSIAKNGQGLPATVTFNTPNVHNRDSRYNAKPKLPPERIITTTTMIPKFVNHEYVAATQRVNFIEDNEIPLTHTSTARTIKLNLTLVLLVLAVTNQILTIL